MEMEMENVDDMAKGFDGLRGNVAKIQGNSIVSPMQHYIREIKTLY